MRLVYHCVLILVFTILQSLALTCRSEHGPKEDELRKIFNNCVKQEGKNNSDSRRHSNEQEWRDRGQTQYQNQRNQWDRDNRNDNREDQSRNRNNGMGDRNRNRDMDETNRRNDGRQNMDGNNYGTNRMDDRYNRMGTMNGVDNTNSRSRSDMLNSYGRNDRLSGRDDFIQSEEYSNDGSGHNYYSTSQSSRRYKREKRIEMNSGQRSQYNPHSQRTNGYEDSYASEGRNSSENSSREMDKACVLHCLLENLQMTGENGMPDRYLVTHTFTKDERNEDLRDFLQESIEECFQILDNENTEDKCDFSKNLLICLSEKGRANCDDWTGKTVFLF